MTETLRRGYPGMKVRTTSHPNFSELSLMALCCVNMHALSALHPPPPSRGFLRRDLDPRGIAP